MKKIFIAVDTTDLKKVKRIITPNWCVWQIQDQGKGLEPKKGLQLERLAFLKLLMNHLNQATS